MGTRADFYLGVGSNAEWLGSVAWDGYEWADDEAHALAADSPEQFRAKVVAILSDRDDATFPHMGWPWPWTDSRTTDYAYCYVDGEIQVFEFGRLVTPKREDWPQFEPCKSPLHSRSGVLCVTPKEK